MQKLHIIWDLDGTLIDSAPEIKAVLAKSIKETGFSEIKPLEPFRSGPPLDKTLGYMYGLQLSAENIEQILSAFRNNYDNCGFNHTPPFDGMEEILADTRFLHHIVTNKPDLATNRILKKLGWKKYFSSVVTPYSYMKSSDDKRKTKTELFALCMKDYPNEKFVGVGDMDTDAKAALENDIPAIGVLWGTGSEKELKACGCTKIVHSVNELKQLLADFC
ncbi:HAD family hydrolase [Treponema sp. UBA3813]|uniref:HAD family hydrolase n=1 Tax=Treponema sp. UBA3813 TaxID=1947715 RepID=UPI0025CE4DB3|nr:HAD family hydrolase [Treponema sp. UBA3813]